MSENFASYVKLFFNINYYKQTYASTIIHPYNTNFIQLLQFNNAETLDSSSDESETGCTLPSSTSHPPGRPKMHYIRIRIETGTRVDIVPSRLSSSVLGWMGQDSIE